MIADVRYAVVIGALSVLGLGALLWWGAQPASRIERGVQPAREPEPPRGAVRAPSTQAPLRAKAPPTGAALSDTTARLRRAKRLSPDQRQEVLRELTDLLLRRPERASDVVALLREFDGQRDWVAAELVAVAIGLARVEAALRGLMELLEGRSGENFEEHQYLVNLYYALASSAQGAAPESGVSVHSNYSKMTGSVKEPYVREWLHRRALELGDMPGSFNAEIAQGLCFGKLIDRDAERLAALADRVPNTTNRANLIHAMWGTQNEWLRDWLRRQLVLKRWESDYEFEQLVYALAARIGPRDAEVLARELKPHEPARAAVILNALQYAAHVDRDAAAPLVRKVTEIAFEGLQWPKKPRARAAFAYRQWVLSNGLDARGQRRALLALRRRDLPAGVRTEFLLSVQFVREADLPVLLQVLRDIAVPADEKAQLVKRLRENHTNLTAEQYRSLATRASADSTLPDHVRVLFR